MIRERIVVGATADDAAARSIARRLRDEGHEVVFVGGEQTADHLLSAAIAEDATRIAVDASPEARAHLVAMCAELGPDGPVVDAGVSDGV